MIPDFGLLNYVLDKSQGCRHVTLIDPGKQSAEIATRRAIASIESGSKMIFVGGSTDTPDEVVHETCKSIQEALELQVFATARPQFRRRFLENTSSAFPGRLMHYLCSRWNNLHDANELNKQKIPIGEQLRGAPYLQKFGVEALPTGYLVFSPGGKVGEVGEAELVQPGQTELTHAYALTAQMFGFKILYLEAGSGATSQVDPKCIESANQVEDLCLIVGGGIRSGEQAVKAAQSGANWIVTGTLTEDAASMDELRQRIRSIVDSSQSSSS